MDTFIKIKIYQKDELIARLSDISISYEGEDYYLKLNHGHPFQYMISWDTYEKLEVLIHREFNLVNLT